MAHRYFTEEIVSDSARISGADAAHLARVLRAKVGDEVLLCNGNGQDFSAQITRIEKEEIFLQVIDSWPTKAEPTVKAEMFIGLAKGERMDYAIQKAVELGASVIWPFESEHTVVKVKKPQEKTERYTRIAHEAAKQCGRGILPQVQQPVSFAEVLKRVTECERALFFYEEGGLPFSQAYQGEKHVALITGAEGGFSPREAAAAKEAGCITIGLGPRILRCETAPAVALTLLMAQSGNLE